MSAIRMIRRLSAASAVAFLFTTLALASPAHAGDDDIDVRLSGLTSSLSAGRGGDGFTVRTENKTDEPLIVNRVITVRLDGLTVDQVRVIRGVPLPANSAAPGEVQFVDPLPYRLNSNDRRGDSVTANYRIEFLDGAPSGQARVTAEAYVNRERFGSDSDELTVRGGAVVTPTTPPASSAPPTSAAPSVSLSPLEVEPAAGSAADDGGVPVFLYVMGAILVAMGGGILWLLLRERPAAVEESYVGAGYPSGQPYQAGHAARAYPTQAYPSTAPPHNPTTVMPVIHNPQSPPASPMAGRPPIDPMATPPAFDPWAPRPGDDQAGSDPRRDPGRR